jgi:hypothetical protein
VLNWSILVHGRTTNKHGFTRFYTTRIWGSHHLPLIVYYVPSHETNTQMLFCPKIPKWKSQNFQSWDSQPIILCADLWLRWGLKQSCSFHWKLSKSMSHATCTQGNRGDFWLLMVECQIVNLISNLFFCHNLCLKCPNGSCKPILNIYVLRTF